MTDDEFNSLQLGPVIAQLFRTSHGIGHLGVREIITEGSWKMAPEFLSELDHLPHDGHSLNLLTGTMLGIMDIGARRTNQKTMALGIRRCKMSTGSMSMCGMVLRRCCIDNGFSN
ncbi:hypothetical protein [Kocuria flava]|uniref:hypothetical protein n=1 Tax=Kocuria flava TaxID=446860 RepID=UPI00117E3BCF|nr:hypothetical protein [Kocuria flava]